MRTLLIGACAAAAALGAGLDALAGERGVARLGGAFASLQASDENACARLCDDDGLCMAWTFRTDGGCSLSAIVAAPSPDPDSISGLSMRAPRALVRAATPVTQPPSQEDAQPVIAEEPEAPEAPATVAAANVPALLGGLDEGDAAFRPRLGN
jgi:hypothetical protein